MFEVEQVSVDEGIQLFTLMDEEDRAIAVEAGDPVVFSLADRLAGVEQYEHLRVRRDGIEVGRLSIRASDPGAEITGIYVGALWVPPELRGRRLGRQLVYLAESQVRARRLRYLALSVRAANRPALRLYAGTGFKPVERVYFRRPGVVLSSTPLELSAGESLPIGEEPMVLERMQLVARRRRREISRLPVARLASATGAALLAEDRTPARHRAGLVAGFADFVERNEWPAAYVSVHPALNFEPGAEWQMTHLGLGKEV